MNTMEATSVEKPTENLRAAGVGMGDWFDLSAPRRPRKRTSHHEEVRKLKEAHGIFTHLCRGGGEWLAMSVPECHAALAGYGLTEEEKEHPIALIAGYGRLLDDAGLITEGHKTEREAVAAIVARLRSNTQAQTRP